MGLHFANNAIALLLVTIDETITGAALYVWPYSAATEGAASLAMAFSIIMIFVVWRAIRWLLER